MFRDAVPNTKLHSSLRKQHVSVQPTAVLTPIHGLRPLRETVVQIDLTTIVAASPASHTHRSSRSRIKKVRLAPVTRAGRVEQCGAAVRDLL